MFEEEDRVIVPDSGSEEAVGGTSRAGGSYLQAWELQIPGLTGG